MSVLCADRTGKKLTSVISFFVNFTTCNMSKMQILMSRNQHHMQSDSVQYYRTSRKGKMHHDTLESYCNGESGMLLWSGRWRYAKVPSVLTGNWHFAQLQSWANYTNAALARLHRRLAETVSFQRTAMNNPTPAEADI